MSKINNMSNIVIGTKNTINREPKKEKYDYPVVTVHKLPETPKGSRKISFNKAAIEVLQLKESDQISITASLEHPILLLVTDLDCEKYNLYKNFSFASKPVYDCIVEKTKIDTSVDNDFKIQPELIPYDDTQLKGVALVEVIQNAPVEKTFVDEGESAEAQDAIPKEETVQEEGSSINHGHIQEAADEQAEVQDDEPEVPEF